MLNACHIGVATNNGRPASLDVPPTPLNARCSESATSMSNNLLRLTHGVSAEPSADTDGGHLTHLEHTPGCARTAEALRENTAIGGSSETVLFTFYLEEVLPIMLPLYQ